MKVTLIEHTTNPEQAIATAAAICYDANTDRAANAARLQRMLKLGHDSPLRFASATFHIADVSRVESHQQVRVAHAGILQRSQRYTNSSECRKVRPPSYVNATNEAMNMVHIAESACLQAYEMLLQCGIPREDARYELQEGIMTELHMTGNFQMWRKWLQARTAASAQWEIRAVANEVAKQLHGIAPNIFRVEG